MKIARTIAVAVLAVSAAVAQAKPTPQVDPSLEATSKRFTAAFNSFDPQAVAGFFAEDGTLITPAGDTATGRAEIAKLYGDNVKRVFEGSKSTFTIRKTRNVGSGAAWLDVDHQVENAKRPDGTTGPMQMHVVMLAQKKGKDWKWLEVRPYVFVQPREGAPAAASATEPAPAK
jgi:uncharacterized protein (TIGR02246 family)